MRYGLSEQTIATIDSVLSHYPQIEKALLYGSRAKGNYKNGSDIDLTLVGGKDLTRSILGKIMDEIHDALLPYTFDLSILSQITDAEVLGHIQRVGVTLYDKKDKVEVGP